MLQVPIVEHVPCELFFVRRQVDKSYVTVFAILAHIQNDADMLTSLGPFSCQMRDKTTYFRSVQAILRILNTE